MLAVLFLVGSLPWEEVLSSQSSRGSGEQTFRILSANISTWGPAGRGFLRSSEVGRFQTVALAEHLPGANSINTLDELWKQTGFRGTAATARQSENSTKGTSGGASIATRN